MSRPVNPVGLGCGAAVGVVAPALGYVLLMATRVQVSDVALVALLLAPLVLCASLLAIPSVRPQAPSLLIGALIGVTILVVVVFGGITLVAWMLSD